MTETRTLLVRLADELEAAATADTPQCRGEYWNGARAYCALGAVAHGRGWDPAQGPDANGTAGVMRYITPEEDTHTVPLHAVRVALGRIGFANWDPQAPDSREETLPLLLVYLNDEQELTFGEIAQVLRVLAEHLS